MNVRAIFFFLLLMAGTAIAQTPATPAINPAVALTPARGLWLSDAKPNHGWSFEVSPTGFMFVTVFTYEPGTGAPSFLTMQGQYVETPGDASGNIGTFTGPVNRTAGGAPIDSAAPGNAAAVQVGTATITFQSGRRAKWTMGANTYDLASLQDYPGIDGGFKLPEGLVGRWMLVRTAKITGTETTDVATSYIRIVGGGVIDGKRVFTAECFDSCVVTTKIGVFSEANYLTLARRLVADLRFTYDPLTRALRSESLGTVGTGGSVRLWNQEILVVSPNELQGRPYRLADGTPSDGSATSGFVSSFRMIRMPDGFVFGP